MSWWRKAAELVVTIGLVLILAVVILDFFLAEDHAGAGYVMIGLVLFFGSFVKLGAVVLLRRRDAQYAAAAQDAHATVRLARPVADVVAILACFWMGTLGCGFISAGADNADVGRFGSLALLVLLGAISVFGTIALVRNGSKFLVLSPHGLQCNRFGNITIAWPDIHSAELEGIGRFGTLKVIILKLVDEAKYLPHRKQPAWAWGDRLVLGSSFTIPLGFDVSSRLVLRAIKARLSAFGPAVPANSAMKEAP